MILNPDGDRGRVLLFLPRWMEAPAGHGTFGVPLEGLAITSALADAGFEVVLLDESLDAEIEPAVERFARGSLAACVWMAELYVFQVVGLLRFLDALGKTGSRPPVLVGGQIVSASSFEMLANLRGVDLFVFGLGEEILPEACRRLVAGESLSGIPGTAEVVGEREVRWYPDRSRPTLRHAGVSLYRRFDLGPYIEHGGSVFGNREPTFKVRAGRGCGKRCRVCYHFRVPLARADPADVVDSLLYLRRTYGVRQFTFYELDFFEDRERALAIADRLAESRFDGRWFALGSICDYVRYDSGEIGRLYRGGLRVVEMGTESGSEAVLRILGKTHRPEEAIEAARRFLEGGIATAHNVIFGVPGETARDRRSTLSLVRRILALGPERVLFHPRLYQVIPRTPLGREALARLPSGEEFPRTYEEALAYRNRFFSRRVYPWMPRGEENAVKNLALYFLPMLQSVPRTRSAGLRAMQRALKAVTTARCGTGFLRVPLDSWLYRRFLRTRIPLVDAFAP